MHIYVQLAKKTIEEYVKHVRVVDVPEELPEDMRRKAGVFVSLKKHGELRGCIGTFMPAYKNLYEEIVRNAIAAATQDPRFNPVVENELDEIAYSVDVLSAPEKVEDIAELNPRNFGVIVVKGHRKGLLLPDLEGVNTVDEQLMIAKMKAGIDPADTKTDIYKFSVERFK